MIKDVLLNLMSYTLHMDQVDCAFRLRSQSIMVKFTSIASGSDRDAIFRTKTSLRGTGLFVSESLTPRRQNIFRTLVKLKQQRSVHAAFTRSGDMFVKTSPESPPVKIANQAALDRLLVTLTQPVNHGRTLADNDCTSEQDTDAASTALQEPRHAEVTPPATVPAPVESELVTPLPSVPSRAEPSLAAPLPPVTPPGSGKGDGSTPAPAAETDRDPGDPAAGRLGTTAISSAGNMRDETQSGGVCDPDIRRVTDRIKAIFDDFRRELHEQLGD